MDPVINSLVQSPLCRMLETLPVKGQSFTYQIADNVPPHSSHKIVVDAQEGAGVNHFKKRLHFNIPQFGYLSKAVLKFTSQQPLVNKSVAYASTSSAGSPDVCYIPHIPKFVAANSHYAATVTPNPGIGLVEKAELMTRNRTIETCYGRQIFQSVLEKDADNSARNMKMAQWHWEQSGLMCMSQVSNVHGTTGQLVSTNDDNLWPTPANDADRKPIVAYCDLPFSVTQDMAHTLNTRFVEPLVVRVNTHGHSAVSPDMTADLDVATGGTGRSLKVQLICYFTNFHDNTEQEIRNTNFKPEVPAGILAYDVVEEQPQLVQGWVGKTTLGDGSGHLYARDEYAGGDVIMPITSNNLATQIITCFDFEYRDPQPLTVGVQDPSNRGYLPLSCWKGCRSFKLKGNGQELIASTGLESMFVDSANEALSSHVRDVGNSSALYSLVQQQGAALSQKLTCLTPASSLKFGMCNSDSYNSGALALQTISNPHISAQPYLHADQHPVNTDATQVEYWTRNSGYSDLKMFSYVKHFALLQIDSGTGAISRGVDA